MKQLVCSKTFKINEIINATNNEGRTALHLAIKGNLHTDLVEIFMIVGSLDVNICDNNGMAPLDLLKERPRSASSELLIRQLISVGATLSSQDYTARKIIASNLKMGELSQIDSCLNSNSNVESKSSKKNKQKGIQRFLGWIRFMKGGSEGPVLTRDLDEIPVLLRQRYSKSSSLPNKRTLAARNYKHVGIDVVGASSSNQMFDVRVDEEEGVVNSRSSVNQCFCFGTHG
nr:hypothetical protein [Tanacetum cinerariifolium]